jgi:hypothetical protein
MQKTAQFPNTKNSEGANKTGFDTNDEKTP